MIYNRHTVLVITPPASFGVTVADMEKFLNLTPGQDTDLLNAFIAASYDAIRQYLRRSIVTETLELRMDGFPGYDDKREIGLGPGVHTVSIPWITNADARSINLPFGPVQSITSLTTFFRDNSSAMFDAANYQFDKGRVYLNESATWPTSLRNRDAVAVRYVSGDAIPPAAILQAIKQHVAAMYECREGCDMPAACKAILQPYRRLDPMGFE
jgi:hypothetical protein